MTALSLRAIVTAALADIGVVAPPPPDKSRVRRTEWLPGGHGIGLRHYTSGRRVYVAQSRMGGRVRTVTIGPASVISEAQAMPELALRRALHALGFRFRLHRKDLHGKPDIVLPQYRTVVFVHGCFWHRHAACKVATTPKSNTSFWVEKFDRNVARDARSSELLEAQGWKVVIAWECELGSGQKAADAALRIAAEIRSGVSRP